MERPQRLAAVCEGLVTFTGAHLASSRCSPKRGLGGQQRPDRLVALSCLHRSQWSVSLAVFSPVVNRFPCKSRVS